MRAVKVEEYPRGPGRDALDRLTVGRDERMLQGGRACEVVRATCCIVPQLSELLARALELAAKRAVGSCALVLEGVRAENAVRRDHWDQADDEDAGQQLQQSSP